MRMIEEEQEKFGDLVILDVSPPPPSPRPYSSSAYVERGRRLNGDDETKANDSVCMLDVFCGGRWKTTSIRERRIGISNGLRNSLGGQGRLKVDLGLLCESR